VELPKNKTALVAGVAVAGIVTTAALGMAVWPALTRPDPPSEATGGDGLRIRLVEPPKALIARGSPLDVGLSEAAQAMTKGREALFVRTPPVRLAPPAPLPARRTPMQVAQIDDDEEDVAPPPEPVTEPAPADDRWERDAWRRDRFEEAQRRRAEEEQRWARRDREERAAWEQAQRDRERDRYDDRRYDDRYAPPPPPDDDRPPPNW
jgi:hypothetical protein